MMRKQTYYILTVFLAAAVLVACEKIRSYPDTPEVTFRQFNYADTSIVFSYVDGSGNFGTGTADTTGIDTTGNIYISMFAKVDTGYQPIEPVNIFHWNIVGVPAPQGQDKTQKGDITIALNDGILNGLENFPDTFRFELYIYDINRNRSNTAVSPDLYRSLLGKPNS